MMSSNIKKILILFSVFLNIGIIILSFYYYMEGKAERKDQRGFTEKGRHISFYRNLGISDEQEKKIDGLLDDYLSKENVMKSENRKLRNELVTIISGEKEPDNKKLDSLYFRIAFLKELREKTTFEHLLKVKEILTVDQSQEMFSKLKQETRDEK